MNRRIVLIDNFDSFTYNLVDYFYRCGAAVEVVRNNRRVGDILQLEPEALVLSPGPESPSKAGNLMPILEHFADKLPILGICLGHQAIGELFGAKIVKAKAPMHGKISIINQIAPHPEVYEGLPEQMEVVRYHSLVIDNPPPFLYPTAITKEHEIMSVRHESLPIHGLQFHPEAILTRFGLDMLQNWLNSLSIAG